MAEIQIPQSCSNCKSQPHRDQNPTDAWETGSFQFPPGFPLEWFIGSLCCGTVTQHEVLSTRPLSPPPLRFPMMMIYDLFGIEIQYSYKITNQSYVFYFQIQRREKLCGCFFILRQPTEPLIAGWMDCHSIGVYKNPRGFEQLKDWILN